MPILVVSPQNQPLKGTLALVKWNNAWCSHYNSTGQDCLDHQYPVILAYNGIHHYTSTEIISGEAKDKAIYRLMGQLLQGISNLGDGLTDKNNRESIISMFTIAQRDIGNMYTNPLAKFTPGFHVPPPPPPAPPGHQRRSAAAPSSVPAPSDPVDKYKYICTTCNRGFQRSNELQNHITSAHGEGFSCEHCDHDPFNSNAALKVHQKTKHGVGSSKNYQCGQCNYNSNRYDALLAHEVKQHGKVVADADMKHCPNEGCTQKFITQEQLSRHLRLICQRGADIPCDDPTCKRVFKNRVQMKAHFASHTDEGKKWKCQECDKQFSSKQAYNNHMQRHT